MTRYPIAATKPLNATPLLCAWLTCGALSFFGCATPTGTTHALESRTLRGQPVQITTIAVPSHLYTHVHAFAGSVWATRGSVWGLPKTVRIDPNSYDVVTLSRPWTAGSPDLLIDDDSMWFSDGMTKITGRGDLYRRDLKTNRDVATIGAVGSPFAVGDGAVWAYNRYTGAVSAIDRSNNRIRQRVVTRGGPYGSMTFGAGSIWQLAFEGNVSAWDLTKGSVPISVVRRIDPRTSEIIAQIPIGPYRPTDGIAFVGGSIWVLGERDTGAKPFATRIDVDTNLVVATIPLLRSMESACAVHSAPKTPVYWDGGVWISTFCSAIARVPYVLVKVDLRTNEVADELRLPMRRGTPDSLRLAAGEGALWGFDHRSAIRIDFQDPSSKD